MNDLKFIQSLIDVFKFMLYAYVCSYVVRILSPPWPSVWVDCMSTHFIFAGHIEEAVTLWMVLARLDFPHPFLKMGFECEAQTERASVRHFFIK